MKPASKRAKPARMDFEGIRSGWIAFVDGKFCDYRPEMCRDQDCAGECDLMPHYGFMDGYGLGGMDLCVRCGGIFNFTEDEG